MAAGTLAPPETRTDHAPATTRPMRGWAVLLHNDDVSEFGYVVRTVVELVRLTMLDAYDRTVEANDSGVSLLVVTHRERAELMQEQFQSRGLTVTIEPAR